MCMHTPRCLLRDHPELWHCDFCICRKLPSDPAVLLPSRNQGSFTEHGLPNTQTHVCFSITVGTFHWVCLHVQQNADNYQKSAHYTNQTSKENSVYIRFAICNTINMVLNNTFSFKNQNAVKRLIGLRSGQCQYIGFILR